jgi:hypothetical protein
MYCVASKNSERQCHFKIWLDCHKLKKNALPDYAHVNKVSKNEKNITSNVIQHDDRLCYDIYDRFTMEHFPLCQSMALTTSFFCSRQYLSDFFLKSLFFIKNKFVTFEISKFILFWTKRLILLRKHT